MVYDQAQSPRLGQRTPVESTYVRMFSGGEVPEAAWPGQLIYINEDQILQIFNGDAWEDVTGGDLGQLTFVAPTPPVAQHVGDVWYNTSDGNRMYLAKSVGADEIKAGEWELVSAAAPPLVPGTHIYRQDTPPGPGDVPPPANNDFWYETPNNHQYYYSSAAPGTHWIFVQDTGIPAAIKSTLTEYSLSASETIAPVSGWSSTAPARTPGTFIWVRTTTTTNDGNSSTNNPALMTGNTGSQGQQGDPGPKGDPGQAGTQGIQGPKGADGVQLYTWVKYADSPSTGMTDTPAGKAYMGLSYNQTTLSESNNYNDYYWSLIQGEQGDTGVPGPKGADGQPTYTWIRYGDDINGANMADSSVGKTYMGIAYNKTTPVENTTDPTLYEWSLIQGPQGVQGAQGNQGVQGPKGDAGANAPYVSLVSTAQALIATPGSSPTNPLTATVTGSATNTTIDRYEYSINGAGFVVDTTTVPPGVSRTGNVVTITGSTMTAKTIAVKMSNTASGVADSMTVAKVTDGAQGGIGGQGPQGDPGLPAYTVLLSNEAAVFPGSTTAALVGSMATGNVTVYKGATVISCTVTPAAIAGLTPSAPATGTNPVYTYTTAAGLANNGQVNIKVDADGKTFNTAFSWSVGLQGTPGTKGDPGNVGGQGPQGTSILTVIPYYQLVTQPSTAPANPGTVATPPGPWTGTEPAYVAGKDLYTTQQIGYSNSTYSYTTVVKSSSYTGSSQANDTANTKTKTYYLPSSHLIPDPIAAAPGDPNALPPIPPTLADPDHMKWAPLTAAEAGVASFTNGDVWYQSNSEPFPNHAWYWDGTQWLDIKDPGIDFNLEAGKTNADAITRTNAGVENVSVVAYDAHDTANTADGRVSMSDYSPSKDDATYTTEQWVVDDATGIQSKVEVEIPRNNGSVWFTRTRARHNLCTNASFETLNTAVPPAVVSTTAGWATSNLTLTPIPNTDAGIDGYFVAKLQNSTSSVHYAEWNPGGVRQPCAYGQTYTVSVYAELVTGTGSQITISINWYDGSGTALPASVSDPVDLMQLNGAIPPVLAIAGWQRPYVTADVPPTAASFTVRVNSPGSNSTDSWLIDGLLVEGSAELGQYFDGDSFDASWDDVTVPGLTTSTMEGGKITQVWELHDSNWSRKYFTDDTHYFTDAANLIGTMDGDILADNSVAPDKAIVAAVQATETLTAGDMVNVYNYNSGLFGLRKACAAPGTNYEAHGFVLNDVANGSPGRIYHAGYNPYVTNLAPGLQWLSQTPGKVTKTPPSATGALVQRIGYAPTSSLLDFQPVQSIRIT